MPLAERTAADQRSRHRQRKVSTQGEALLAYRPSHSGQRVQFRYAEVLQVAPVPPLRHRGIPADHQQSEAPLFSRKATPLCVLQNSPWKANTSCTHPELTRRAQSLLYADSNTDLIPLI